MVDLSNILTTVFKNLANLLPFRTIYQGEQGIRWTFGRAKNPLEPGLHWFLYVVQKITSVDVTERTVDFGSQTLTSLEGVPHFYNSVAVARVTNAHLYVTTLGQGDAANVIQGRGRATLATAFHEDSSDSPSIDNLQTRVSQELEGILERRGAELIRYGITENAPITGVHRVLGINDTGGYETQATNGLL